MKLQLTVLFQFLKIPNTNFLEVTDFVLHVTYSQPSNEKAPYDARYPMLFFKKKNKIFNNIKSLLPDQRSLNMKILRASFAGYSMSNVMQPVYQALNPVGYGRWLIDGVHVPV